MKKKIIKIIAVILMAAFIAQDIVLAFPKIHRNTSSQSSLQIPSMFQDIRFDRYASMLEVWLKYVLSAISYSKDFNYRLTLSIGAEGIKVDLNFDRQYPEGENTVLPCALYTPTSSRLYEAVITPDGSIQLRDAAVVRGGGALLADGTHNFIAEGIVAHNTYTAPPALRRYNLDGGQTPQEYLALLKSKLEEYRISTKNLPDEPEQVTAEQIIELWVGIKDTEKEDIIKQALTTTGLKDMLLSLSLRPSEDEIISELGLALAKKILSYLEDNFINSLSEKLEQHRFSEIYSMILELSSKNALVELIRNDKDLEIFKGFNLGSGNTFIEELLNKLTGISNLVHQLAEAKITLDSTLDEKGKVPQQLLNRALQDIKDILNELSRRITTYQQHSKSAQQSGRPDSVKKDLSGIDFPGSLGDEAGFYDPAYVVSNESYRDIARKLRGLIKKQNIEKGRVYLGVSFEQNLSFIAAVDPEMAIILDNNRYVTGVAFPMIMALIRESTDLEDMKKRLSALKNLQEADKLIMKALPSGPHQIMAKGIWRDKGPQWVGQWLSYWQKEDAWLRSKEDFDTVKRLVQDNKIKTISGDWNGETPKYLAGYLKGIGKEINVLYLSNVVPSDMCQNFLDGVENLPKSDNCVVIHGLGRYVGPVVQPYNTSILKIVHKLQQKEKEFPIIYLASGLYWLGLEAGGGLFSQKRIAEAVEPIGYILKTYKDTHPHWPELIKEILATQIKTAEDKDAQRVYQEALGRLIDLHLLPPEDIVQARGEQQLAAFVGRSMEGQNAPPLCLTPDSLIALADGSQNPPIELREGEKALSLDEETPQPTKVTDRPGGVDLDRKLTRLVAQLGALQGSEQKNNFGNKLILLSKILRGINECFGQGRPDLAAQIAVDAIKNHIPGFTSEIVTNWINECFGQGRPDSAAQIAIEAIKNHIPDITSEIVTNWINECFGQGRPDLAAQIAIEAIKNHISGIPPEIVTRGISECFEKGRSKSAAQIAVEAIKNHIPGVTPEMVTRGIDECFRKGWPKSGANIAVEAIKNHIPVITSKIVTSWIDECFRKGWPDSAAQIAVEAIKNHISGVPFEIVTRGISECFKKGWPKSAAQIAVEAIKNHIPGVTPEIVTSWIDECFRKGRPDAAAQIAVEAIKNHIPGITPEMVTRGIDECFRKGWPDAAAQIAVEAIKNHIPGITPEMVTRGIDECFVKGPLDAAAQIAAEAIKNHIPGVTPEIVTNWINKCFGKDRPDLAAQIAAEAEKGIPVTKGTERIMAILQELAGGFGAKTDNYFLYLITGYALQNNLLPELPVSSRGIRENAFIIPMIEKIISIEGEGITINEIFRPGGIEGLVKLYHKTYDYIFSDILPEGLDIDNPRVSVLLKTITHFDTSPFSRQRGESFAELYRQFSEDYGQGKIKPLPPNLPPGRLIDVHTRRIQVLSIEARKYYQALMDAVKAALSAIDSARQAKGAGEGNEYAYKDTIQKASGIIDEEIKSLKERENVVPDKAMPFLNKRVDLLKVLKQKLSGAIGREGLPLLAVSKDEFRELAGLKGAPLLIRTMLFIHAFLNNPNWQDHFRNPMAREPDLANTARFIEFVDSFIKPHLLDEAPADVKRLILDCVNARVFKDENERLIGRKDLLTRRINIRPIRGWLAEFIGYFSDECWTRTINIMRDNPDAIALVFEDSDSKELLGGTLLMPNIIGGRKVLIDRGLSPRTEVTSGLDVKDFVEQVADFEEEIAAALGAEMIVVPLRSLEPGLGSNNPDIIQYYERAIGTRPVIHLDTPNEFNNHDITSGKCVVLREVSAEKSESPVDFLRDIVDTEQLSRNMAEYILSYVFSNKRLVLAFDDNLTGLKRQKVRQIIQAVEAWKEAAANKSDAMRRLLTNNLTVLQYSSLDELREKLGPDLDDNERNIIFAFTARIEDEAHSPANMGRAVRAVLMEGEEKFTEEDYYPLVEVVTLALAKELSGWNRSTLLSNLAKLNIDYRRLGISDIDEDNRGIIIFRLLPVMKRYDSNERVDRYARLLQFLRSA